MNYNHIKLTPSKTYHFDSFFLYYFLYYHTIINLIFVMQKKT